MLVLSFCFIISFVLSLHTNHKLFKNVTYINQLNLIETKCSKNVMRIKILWALPGNCSIPLCSEYALKVTCTILLLSSNMIVGDSWSLGFVTTCNFQ